jgi:Flp pilus assembly secretin CpaC
MAMNVRKRTRGIVMGLVATAAIATAAETAEPVRLYVTVDKAELVNVPAMPISKIAVTNPNIADVYVINPTQILLSGKQAGTTSLTLFHRGGTESFDVVVHPGPVGNSKARLVPSESHAVEVQRAGKVSQQLFVRDEDRAWVQLGGGKAEPEASAK